MSAGWHVAQVNIALPREPLDSPALAEFVANLEPVNALADAAPGFVWRLADETGDATSIRAFDDERLIINMSVWASIEALWEFVYSGRHLEVMRRRREWMTSDRRDLHGALVAAGRRAADDRRRPPAPRPPPGPRPDPVRVHVQAPLPAAGERDGAAPGPSTRTRCSHSSQLVAPGGRASATTVGR